MSFDHLAVAHRPNVYFWDVECLAVRAHGALGPSAFNDLAVSLEQRLDADDGVDCADKRECEGCYTLMANMATAPRKRRILRDDTVGVAQREQPVEVLDSEGLVCPPHDIDVGHIPSLPSAAEVLVAEVSSGCMELSRALPADRLAIGQILVRLLHRFRTDLFAAGESEGRFLDLRFVHLQVWGNVGIEGIRLTALADRANLGLPACSELVNELQEGGYLERRPDPRDGRAKLIFPTPKGREVLDTAGRIVADLEQRWRQHLPTGDFDAACRTLNDLLLALDDEQADVDKTAP